MLVYVYTNNDEKMTAVCNLENEIVFIYVLVNNNRKFELGLFLLILFVISCKVNTTRLSFLL